MIKMTALRTFYDKDINPRKHVFRGETFTASERKADQLRKKQYANPVKPIEDYEKKVIEPEIKEEPSEPAEQQPETETKEDQTPDPTAEPEPLQDKTISELKELLEAKGIDYPAKAKKAELIALLENEK